MSGWPASSRLRLAAILTALGSSSQHGSLSASSARWLPTPPRDQPSAGLVEPSPEQVEGRQPDEPIPRSALGPQRRGRRRTTKDSSCRQRVEGSAAQPSCRSLTSDDARGRCGVRVSPPPPTGLLLAAVREDGRLVDPSELLDGAAHSVLLDDDDAPVPEKSWPPSQNYSVGSRTTPRGSAATSVKAPGPALPMQRGAVEHHPVQDALDTVPLVPVDHCQ